MGKDRSNQVMLAEGRRSKILELMKETGQIHVKDLVDQLGVSIATVRRDLSLLKTGGLIKRSHGGAVLRERVLFEFSYQERENKFVQEKRAIAEKALEFIEDGDRIFFNDGTTVMQIARLMASGRFPGKITVMTNSLRAADILLANSRIEVLFVGGTINEFSYASSGPLAELVIDHLRADKTIIGVDAVSPDWGIGIQLIPEASITRKMIDLSDQVIIVADSSKMNTKSAMKVCYWDKINLFIIDSLSIEDRRAIEQHGVVIPKLSFDPSS